ncbi:MAG: hypothetical protein J6330_02775 [Clostridia bacterium]|nr:hypothetical protein [Clostridia bacterium]
MSLLDKLSDPLVWERFCEYKTSLAAPKAAAKELRAFIDEKAYLPVCETIRSGDVFPLPKKSVISKLGSDKKRTVYTYPYAENMTLKLLTYLLLRKYDGLFSGGLYSFRPGRTAKDAVRRLIRTTRPGMYHYKVDIHDYFNSVPVEAFLPKLCAATEDDPALYAFLSSLLREPRVTDKGAVITERKGIMAGTPLASFYANLYLCDLDRHFEDAGVPYARYSDDIIVFDDDSESVARHAEYIKAYLQERGLTVNPKKESFGAPEDGFTFLGFICRGGVVDIAPATVTKLKQKMRRKTRALQRWRKRSDSDPERAAASFIRVFNRKLLDDPQDNELTWSCWFFSVINTTKSLHEIDVYAQECIRYLISDSRGKSRFRVKYGDMKALGYKNLVHEYYEYEKNAAEKQSGSNIKDGSENEII